MPLSALPSSEMSPDKTDYMLAMMMRVDPERLAAVRRAISKRTRCPICDEVNRADQRYCDRCGAPLYPDLEEEQARKKRGAENERA